MPLKSIIGSLLAGKYMLLKCLGSGAYGTVYAATDVRTREPYAVKVEDLETRSPSLKYECSIYRRLHQFGEVKGVPKVYHYEENESFRALVMDRLAENIESGNTLVLLPANQVFDIGYRGVGILKTIHAKGFLHLDLKPDNLMYGFPKKGKNFLYIVDYGMAESLIDWRTGKHRTIKKEPNVGGSITFSSINTHNRVSRSRKDDLESLGYSLICLFKGMLPWESDFTSSGKIKSFELGTDSHDEMYDQAGIMKEEITVESLCEGLPEAMQTYFRYVRNLSFSEEPNYEYLMTIFQKGIQKNCVKL